MNMNEILIQVTDALKAMPWWAFPAAVGVFVVILLIVVPVMKHNRRVEREDLNDQVENLKRELDALDAECKQREEKLAALNAELDQTRSELAQTADNLTRRDEELEQTRNEMTQTVATLQQQALTRAAEVNAQLEQTRAAADAQMLTQQTEAAARLQARETELNAQIQAKNNEIAKMQEAVDRWNRERDTILSNARRDADEIRSEAYETAENIRNQASVVLAQSEEEVRKNRLTAANTLSEARRYQFNASEQVMELRAQISEALGEIASNLCKGLPNSGLLGYASVYSIKSAEETSAQEAPAQEAPAEEVTVQEEVPVDGADAE